MTTFHPPLPGELMPRDLFLTILRAALTTQEVRFARQAALNWLSVFPGDLPVNLLYAQALLLENHPDQAGPILDMLCQADPEYLEATEARHQILKTADSLGWVRALGGNRINAGTETLATWSHNVLQARQALTIGSGLSQAEEYIHQALAAEPSQPLVAVTHLKVMQALQTPRPALRNLAQHYHQRWPDCLQFNLVLADLWMDGGNPEKAVALLHQAAARDITGQVAVRLWGEAHPYRTLWPERLGTYLDMAIPAAIAVLLGWNQLPGGQNRIDASPEPIQSVVETIHSSFKAASAGVRETPPQPEVPLDHPESRPSPVYSPIPEALRSVQAELERVGAHLNQSGLTHSDGRFPVYVVMTTRQGLKTIYGEQAARVVEAEMQRLVETVREHRDWDAMLFYADDCADLGIQTAKPSDPWGLKLALADLDAFLGRRGEMIGAVLIVGGPEVVPFHHLPNPVDDADVDVPSDNPYGTRDENYFIPEWPVGRLPGGAGSDSRPLLHVLQTITARHAALARQKAALPWYQRWWEQLLAMLNRQPSNTSRVRRTRKSYGYTAAVWRRASLSVFRPIGEPRAMLISPPVQASPPNQSNGGSSQGSLPLPPARLAYFNLHGLEDAAEWYGQSDPSEEGHETSASGNPANGIPYQTDYPIALRPKDILNSGRAPQVVFSEACYGAHILGKTVEEALALKFLQAGSQAVTGSTCTAYGSISTPLIAADFLGHAFWKYLREGLPAGEALRRAKIALAREMHHRQGYLDGEDQKTLISFVLYGDPLAQPLETRLSPKSVLRPIKPPVAVSTICDRARQEDSQAVSPEMLSYVKHVVEQYLPGMADAHLTVNHEHAECNQAGHQCPTAQLGVKLSQQPNRRVVVLSKQVAETSRRWRLHRHYARLTLDEQGKLVKLVVSR